MHRKKLECVEVIEMKEVIHKIDTHGQLIFVITKSHGLKVRISLHFNAFKI